ncbi:macrolide family glycosyltransferase [Clostridium estertheticum]|uniref:Glycosyl transferase n=1 Tax=Clostridium estertheticum TaxID=238834 RepID=A0A7Y3SYM7_9CLOT|nr:macrolide family glycosyltransferase [Clostridium estertheticum]MBW9173072.1 glycosyl transferase [Clostridium estertheticum]NNU77627.1 glycosyl transferase [Clostridium estertheticum]WBL48078.1 glycosyl transferase [Clostridium estertheticum]WLC76165.1 glycosyl transferase [Clostridium estertheticum]
MSNALFISMFGTGHVNPTIGLVKELMNRGEQVTYISGEEFRGKIEKTGARFKGLKNSANFEDSKQPMETLARLEKMFEEILEIVVTTKEKFDYIIYDAVFIIGNELGRVLKIPTICSITTFATNENTNIFSDLFRQVGPIIQPILNSSVYINFVKNLQEKYDIKFPSITTAVGGTGTINIVYTSKYLQICGESFDESYKFIGPSIADRNENMSLSLEANDKKVIYIALGTIFNNSIEFYESCFKAFGDMNVEIIMSVGKNIDVNTFKSIPSNFVVKNYVSQLEILKQADVFITHGGMNSTNEGLYYDVPLILIPQFADQPFVAKRVAELGAGIIIEKDKVTTEILKQSVVKIFLDNNFRRNSEKIGKSLREAGGYKKAVDEIFNLNQ